MPNTFWSTLKGMSLFVKAVVFMASSLRAFFNLCVVTELYPDTTR